MTKGRIWFEGNPWPNGHAIKSADLFITLSEGGENSWPPETGAYLGLKIKTDDYYAEMLEEERNRAYEAETKASDNNEHIADWTSFIVWQNYGACRIESSNAQIGTHTAPFDLINLKQAHLSFDTGMTAVADQENDMNAFTCYILGHDSVANHELSFTNTHENPNHFDIDWSGSVALSYLGDNDFSHRFRAKLTQVPFLGVKGPRYQELREVKSSLFGLFKTRDYYDLRQDREPLLREKALRQLASSCLKLDHKTLAFQAKQRCDWLVPKER